MRTANNAPEKDLSPEAEKRLSVTGLFSVLMLRHIACDGGADNGAGGGRCRRDGSIALALAFLLFFRSVGLFFRLRLFGRQRQESLLHLLNFFELLLLFLHLLHGFI